MVRGTLTRGAKTNGHQITLGVSGGQVSLAGGRQTHTVKLNSGHKLGSRDNHHQPTYNQGESGQVTKSNSKDAHRHPEPRLIGGQSAEHARAKKSKAIRPELLFLEVKTSILIIFAE